MLRYVLIIIVGMVELYSTTSALDVAKNYTSYSIAKEFHKFPSYTAYLSLMVSSVATNLSGLIRQPGDNFPGDYFWPPNALLSSNPEDDAYNSPLNPEERSQIAAFLNNYFPERYCDSTIIASLQGYYYEFRSGTYEFHVDPRREFYIMLTAHDTVFVISGLLGKFMSFYRAVPGDFKLTPTELLMQVGQLSSVTKNLDVKESAFKKQDDPENYFLEYVDKEALVRIRNYKLEAVLPPSNPDSEDRRIYNLIEITKVIDGSLVPSGR